MSEKRVTARLVFDSHDAMTHASRVLRVFEEQGREEAALNAYAFLLVAAGMIRAEMRENGLVVDAKEFRSQSEALLAQGNNWYVELQCAGSA